MSTSPRFLNKENSDGVKPVRHHSLALICHVYYPDLFEELVAQFAPLENNFDLYISISQGNLDLIPTIFNHFPNAYILVTENIGRDVNPFMVILKTIEPLGYDTFLKLHTKLSPHRSDGNSWRQDMVTRLIGSKENVEKIREKFAQNQQVGLIASQGHVISYRAYCGASRDRVLKLAQATGLDYSDEHDFPFAAGTMFWANPKALELLTHIPDDEIQYEEEPIIEDGALVHAIERFIGLAVESAGFTILDVDGNGNISKPDLTLDYPYTPSSKQLKLRNVRSIILFSPYDERFAIEHVRITAPYTQAGIKIIQGVVNGALRLDRISTVDAVVFQREFPRDLRIYNQVRQIAEEHTIPIIYDLDDLLFSLPENHPERQSNDYTDALMPMMTALVNADLVTVATEKLKETLADFNENIQVVPNYLDDALWKLRAPAGNVGKEAVVTIGYMGSSSHTPDLEMIAPVLSALLDKFGEKLRLHVWGTPLPNSLKEKPGVVWTASPSNHYREFANYFQTQSADIFVAPLSDNLFNRCKSGLKFLEYGALGVPGVFSNLDGYAALVTNGQEGFLAASLQDWEQALIRLIEAPELRAEMAHNAQAIIRNNWLLSQNISSWQDVLRSGELSFGNKRQAKMASADLLSAISGQVFWMQKAKDDLAHQLNNEVQTSVADLEKERRAYQKLDASLHLKVKELEALAARFERAESEIKSLNDLAKQNELSIDVLNQQRAGDVIEKQRLVGALDEKTVELISLENRIRHHEQMIDSLNQQKTDNEAEIRHLAEGVSELNAIKASRAWQVALFLRRIRAKIAPVDGWLTKAVRKVFPLISSRVRKTKNKIRFRRDFQGIRKSQLFDKDWYLIVNPDVQRAGADPVTHYMLHGAFEGRDPGPKFSSSQYLEDYEDVKLSGMNPLVHYLRFGDKEGRKIAPARNIEPERISYDGILPGKQVFLRLKNQMKHDAFVLSVSHDNYLENVGGVQIKLADEQIASQRMGLGYLHLYPYINRPILTGKNELFFVGVNLNGKEIGVTDRSGIKYALKKLGHGHVRDVNIHHTMGFDIILLRELVKIGRKKSAKFWLHDFFSICPGYFLLRNDVEFCGVPDVQSNECSICKYGKQRRLQHPEFEKLFSEINLEVIAPSRFALDLWKNSFSLIAYTAEVIPNLILLWEEPSRSIRPAQKIRIAFVGFPVNHKGWGAWKRLIDQFGNDPRYKFIHFSSVKGDIEACETVPISVSPGRRAAMADALRDNEIDISFLWSICPETFSYTLYESLAAGCYIVTNKDSGNIQDYIGQKPQHGIVLENEKLLHKMFVSGELTKVVSEYQKDGIPKAELIFPLDSGDN